MKVLVNRISGERVGTVTTAFRYYHDTLIKCGVSEKELQNMNLEEFKDKLNELDIYGCGACFLVEDI